MKTVSGTARGMEEVYEATLVDGVPDGGPDADTREAYDDLVAGLDSTTDEVSIRVHRLPMDDKNNASPNLGQQIYLFSAPVGLYKYEEIISRVKNEFMAPDEKLIAIRVACYRTGRQGAVFNRIIRIQKEFYKTPAIHGQSETQAVLQAIQAMMQQNAQLMQAIMHRPEPVHVVPADPIDQLGKLMGALGPMLTAMTGRPLVSEVVQQKSFVDQLIELKKVKEVMGGLFEDDSGGGIDDGDSTAAILRALAPLAMPLVQAIKHQNANAAAVPHAQQPMAQNPPILPVQTAPQEILPIQNTASAPARFEWPTEAISSPVAEAPILPPLEEPTVFAQLRPQLEALAAMAAEGADPVATAKEALSMLPENEDIDAQLYRLLSDPKCIDKLALIQAKVNEHRPWFEQLIAAMLADFSDT